MFPYQVSFLCSSSVETLEKEKLDWFSLFVLTTLMNMESVPVL